MLFKLDQNLAFAVPSLDKFPNIEDDENHEIPGELRYGVGDISLNNGRRAVILKVVNTGDRPVQVHPVVPHIMFAYFCPV